MEKLKRKAASAMSKKRELPEQKRVEIEEAFALFDSDKDGELDYHELKVSFVPLTLTLLIAANYWEIL